MRTAKLHNGDIVRAENYNADIHGSRIYCIDEACKAPVIFVSKGKYATAHFKTTGKLDSQHQQGCGFYQPLDCGEAIQKVKEYQDLLFSQKEKKETVIRLNMNRIDPDYESKTIDREKSEKKDEDKVKVKDDRENPASIGSVKGVVKLMTSYEPDLLATILFNVGGGRKVPLSSLIVDQEEAHRLLWSDEVLKNVGYFVHGTIKNITRREKVWYVNFEEKTNVSFTLVIFEKYFSKFTFIDEELENKEVLVYGHLSKNEYNGENKTEMIIKSDKYLEKIKSNV